MEVLATVAPPPIGKNEGVLAFTRGLRSIARSVLLALVAEAIEDLVPIATHR